MRFLSLSKTTLGFLALFSVAALSGLDAAQRGAAGGDPDRGKVAIRRYGCGACHTIPGIHGANATVGPPLDKIAGRSYLAGMLPNTSGDMMQWIQYPQRVLPRNAMPDMGVSERDARDIAAYLYTLK